MTATDTRSASASYLDERLNTPHCEITAGARTSSQASLPRTRARIRRHRGSEHAADIPGVEDIHGDLIGAGFEDSGLERILASIAVAEGIVDEFPIDPRGINLIDLAEHEARWFPTLRCRQLEARGEPDNTVVIHEAVIRIRLPVDERRVAPVGVAATEKAIFD
jgi:hypothetical protein